jgi:hypothetical protein
MTLDIVLLSRIICGHTKHFSRLTTTDITAVKTSSAVFRFSRWRLAFLKSGEGKGSRRQHGVTRTVVTQFSYEHNTQFFVFHPLKWIRSCDRRQYYEISGSNFVSNCKELSDYRVEWSGGGQPFIWAAFNFTVQSSRCKHNASSKLRYQLHKKVYLKL